MPWKTRKRHCCLSLEGKEELRKNSYMAAREGSYIFQKIKLFPDPSSQFNSLTDKYTRKLQTSVFELGLRTSVMCIQTILSAFLF